MNKLYFTRVVEKTWSFYIQPSHPDRERETERETERERELHNSDLEEGVGGLGGGGGD